MTSPITPEEKISATRTAVSQRLQEIERRLIPNARKSPQAETKLSALERERLALRAVMDGIVQQMKAGAA